VKSMVETFRFLIIDDSSMMRRLIKKLLRDMGATDILSAVNGEEAWTVLNESFDQGAPVEVIICDWVMPKMTGLEFLKKVRSDYVFADVSFLMVTQQSESPDVEEAIISGVDNYLLKPFNATSFMEKLTILLGSRKS